MLQKPTGSPTNYLGISLPTNQDTTSIYVDVGGVWSFVAGEALTWTNLP